MKTMNNVYTYGEPELTNDNPTGSQAYSCYVLKNNRAIMQVFGDSVKECKDRAIILLTAARKGNL